jgi:hypothetical protein
LVNGVGNSLLDGQNLGQALGSGLKQGLMSGVTGGISSGIASGIDAAMDGRRFFDGATVQKTVLYDGHLPPVSQRGAYNCGPADAESVSGGRIPQEQFRAALGGDPNKDGVVAQDLWNEFTKQTGRPNLNLGAGLDTQNMLTRLQNHAGSNISINLRVTTNMGHSVTVNRITEKVVNKISGKVTSKLLLFVMDPARGQYTRMYPSGVRDAFSFYQIFK